MVLYRSERGLFADRLAVLVEAIAGIFAAALNAVASREVGCLFVGKRRSLAFGVAVVACFDRAESVVAGRDQVAFIAARLAGLVRKLLEPFQRLGVPVEKNIVAMVRSS